MEAKLNRHREKNLEYDVAARETFIFSQSRFPDFVRVGLLELMCREFSSRSDITRRERTDRSTRSTSTRHGCAILVAEAAVTVVVVDVDLVSVDLSFFFVSCPVSAIRKRASD